MLSNAHRRELIIGSGLTDGIVAQRGYDTITAAKELEALGFNNGQSQLAPALLIPLHWNGEIVQHQIKPDHPRIPKGAKKAAKYETPAGSQPRLDCHPSAWNDLRDPAKPLLVTEGLKKADSGTARGITTIGLIGVYGFLGRNEKGGVCTLSEWDDVPLRRRQVYICLDSDAWTNPQVQAAMIRLGRFLKKRGAKVTYLKLAPKENGEKVGLDDYWQLPGASLEALLQMVGDPEEEFSIMCDTRALDEIVADGVDALVRANDPPTLFIRDSDLVTVNTNERRVTTISAPTMPQLRLLLAEASRWHTKKGPCSPPREVAESIHSRRNLPFPPIVGTTKGPLLSENGTITAEYGYCPHSRMWMDSETPLPWVGNAQTAVAYLREEIFGGFTFKSEADWAHTLCLALLGIVRPIIHGSTPLHLIGAPVQSSGKSLLGKVCLMMTQGEIAPTPMRANEEEVRKHITSTIRMGKNYIMLDNLTNTLASATLAVALTGGVWEDRILGGNQLFQAKINQVLVATANNPILDRDMLERSVRIWIDPDCEFPGERKFDKDLESYVPANLRKIQGALIAIVAGWVADGSPRVVRPHKFSSWAATMGGICQTAGVDGFLANTHDLREQSGSMEEAWARFYLRWESQRGYGDVGVGDVIDLWTQDDELLGLIPDNNDRGLKAKFGALLRSRVGLVCGGLKIERSRHSTDVSSMYRLVKNGALQTTDRLIDLVANQPVMGEPKVRI